VSDHTVPNFPLPDVLPADPVLVDLIPDFVDLWMRDLTTMWADIKSSGDTEEFRRFGHTIKGSFLQFGFKELAAVGKSMMDDAANSDWQTADLKVQGLIDALQRIKTKWC